MKNLRILMALVCKLTAAMYVMIFIMGAFSNASAKDKEFGRLKYNPEIISKFASYAPLPKNEPKRAAVYLAFSFPALLKFAGS